MGSPSFQVVHFVQVSRVEEMPAWSVNGLAVWLAVWLPRFASEFQGIRTTECPALYTLNITAWSPSGLQGLPFAARAPLNLWMTRLVLPPPFGFVGSCLGGVVGLVFFGPGCAYVAFAARPAISPSQPKPRATAIESSFFSKTSCFRVFCWFSGKKDPWKEGGSYP